ncbi:hypothetical protein QYF61_004441 [Mycteria americana]|uniref:Uncharacterized protein n=1 Tax=Mycteria americana TaxID=33587 RepID=A0AAN7RK21_MYCAM|nr:hypothetical protein QYF61_004441 [Mycteria americana]
MLENIHLKAFVAVDNSMLQQVHHEASVAVHEIMLEHLKALHRVYCVHFEASQYKTDMDKLERVQQKAIKIIRKQETEGQGEDLNIIFSYLTGGYREDGVRLFLEIYSGWTKGNRHQLLQGKLLSDTGKNKFHNDSGQIQEQGP